MSGTGLTGGGDRSDRCELKLLQLLCFQVICMHSSRGSCISSGGACMCAGRALCGCSSFVLVVCALCLSFVLSFSSDLALCLCLAFDRLLEFLFIHFFSFSFLSCFLRWVLSMHSSRGRLRTMCGSRTGGWSLPCVMSA
jgi:hypothetical protein